MNIEDKIIYYAQKYYEGNPEISDVEFDALVEELKSINPSSDLLNRVGWGYDPKTSPMEKHLHQYNGMTGISTKISPSKFSCEDMAVFSAKLDGASVGIYYEEGKLIRALTRGNGVEGLDITDKIKYLVPMTLPEEFTGRVRGEFVISNEVFYSKYDAKSPRNTAAGFLNQRDWDVDAINDFMLIAYTVTDDRGYDLPQVKGYVLLEGYGFNTVNYLMYEGHTLSDETATRLLDNLATYGDYTVACDGIVTYVGDEILAIKWVTATEITEVKSIRWQVSRLGKLTPVVEFNSVELSGATLSNVSGFNYQYIEENGLGEGSIIEVIRSGEVIPYIRKVVESKGFSAPERCPECGGVLARRGVDLVCTNFLCPAVVIERVKNFVAEVCDIHGLGGELLTKYISHYNLNSLVDFIKETKDMSNERLREFVDTVSGLGDHAYNLLSKLVSSLNSDVSAEKLMAGIGIPGIGGTYAKKLFSTTTVSDFLKSLIDDDYKFYEGSLNITGRRSLAECKDEIIEIYNVMRVVEYQEEVRGEQLLVCITGKLSKPRKAFTEELAEYGISESSIATAQILITDNPDSSSSKNKYASEHNIPKMTESEFRVKYLQRGV